MPGILTKKTISEKIPYRNFVFASLAINLIGIILVFLLQKKLPPEVPLFYGLPEGEEQLTNPQGLILPFIVSSILTIFNTILTFLLEDQFLQKTLAVSTLATSILAFVTVSKIILLVGSL